MMYCAECGSEMTRHDHGAWRVCCAGLGYWYVDSPTPKDQREYGTPISCKIVRWASQRFLHLWFYPTVKWPKGQQPVIPSLD